MGGTDGRKGLSIRVCRFSLVLSASLMIKVFSLSDVGREGTFAGEFMPCFQAGREKAESTSWVCFSQCHLLK